MNKSLMKKSALIVAIASSFIFGANTISAQPNQASETQITEESNFVNSIKWDAEYDVVVLGYGFAGGAAAISAADAGAKVLLLEKAPKGHEGGNSRYAAQQAIWIDSTKATDEEILEYFRQLRGKATNPSDEVYKAYIAEAKKQVDYLKFLGVQNPLIDYYAEYPNFTGADAIGLTLVKKPGGDGKLYAAIQENVQKRANSIDVWFEAPGKKLLQDPKTGVIHGVIAQVEGKNRFIRAKNGVVLATGGFENNIEMFRNYGGLQSAYSKGARFNTGDGIVMANEVNAKIVNMSTLNGPDPNVINPETGISFGYTIAGNKPSPWGGTAFTRFDAIMVGKDGKRFWNETEKTKHGRIKFHDDYRALQMPDPAFLVFDEDARKTSKLYHAWSEGNLKEIESGLVKKANSIEELAKLIGVDATGLKKQIEDFNSFAKSGLDTQFNRPKEYLKAIDNAPFYAVEVSPTFTNTQGGPQHDEIGAVLDVNGKRIPHLFSAGELGSIFSWKYNGTGNIGESLIFGRISGKEAAKAKEDSITKSLLTKIAYKPKNIDAALVTQSGEKVGKARGIGGDVVIGVKTDEKGTITSVRVIESHETEGIGSKALDVLPKAVVGTKGEKVDTVAGATVTSNAFKEALEKALK